MVINAQRHSCQPNPIDVMDINTTHHQSKGKTNVGDIRNDDNCRTDCGGCNGEGIEDLFAIERYFASIDDTEAIYFTHVITVGFEVRKSFKCKAEDGNVKMRMWVCSKEGFRPYKYLENETKKWAPRPITRTGCKVEFRVSRDFVHGRWVSTYFNPYHNHLLTKLTTYNRIEKCLSWTYQRRLQCTELVYELHKYTN